MDREREMAHGKNNFPIVLFLIRIACNTSNASRHVAFLHLLTCCTCMITFHTGHLLLLCVAQLDWLPDDVWNITQHHLRFSVTVQQWGVLPSFPGPQSFFNEQLFFFFFWSVMFSFSSLLSGRLKLLLSVMTFVKVSL